jgi:FkbM family methyltransferase
MAKLDTVNTYFQQFGILNALRFLCAGVSQSVFDRHKISSYSQRGEDRIIGAILSGIDDGFYVDVGCNHPQHYSNTFALYKRGWSGINIDGNSQLIEEHQRLRKRDTSICAVISDKEQEAVFTEFKDSLVSSLSTEHVNQWKERRKVKERRTVKTVSLNTILDLHKAPHKFDLLSIDVEGHDFEVLSSINLSIYRPRLIVVEMLEFDLANLNSDKICQYLKNYSYKMAGYIVSNAYFVDTLKRTP